MSCREITIVVVESIIGWIAMSSFYSEDNIAEICFLPRLSECERHDVGIHGTQILAAVFSLLDVPLGKQGRTIACLFTRKMKSNVQEKKVIA